MAFQHAPDVNSILQLGMDFEIIFNLCVVALVRRPMTLMRKSNIDYEYMNFCSMPVV
jgi:hypothetical protein